MVEEILARGWDNFVARTTGPLSFRFVMQPLIAGLLAIRAGMRDAAAQRPAFLWAALTSVGIRRALWGEGVRDVGNVLLLAAFFDAIYQITVQRGVYALELLFTALTLALVPYVLLRGPVNRLATRIKRRPPLRGRERGLSKP